jgi:hypothetical protein
MERLSAREHEQTDHYIWSEITNYFRAFDHRPVLIMTGTHPIPTEPENRTLAAGWMSDLSLSLCR